MEVFEVMTELRLGYGSHVHRPTPDRYKLHTKGAILRLDVQAFNGNVWFYDEDGERGKVESGSVSNLEERGIIRNTR